MSQIEQSFREFIHKHPEVIACYHKGLINRRALAKHLIKLHLVKSNQLEATIATIRRFDFSPYTKQTRHNQFEDMKLQSKNNIAIITTSKTDKLQEQIQKLQTTDKIKLREVVGSKQIKLFIENEDKEVFQNNINKKSIINQETNISQISVTLNTKGNTKEASKEAGIIAQLTTKLALHQIPIREILTCSPELLIYINEGHMLKTLEVLTDLKNQK